MPMLSCVASLKVILLLNMMHKAVMRTGDKKRKGKEWSTRHVTIGTPTCHILCVAWMGKGIGNGVAG